MNLKEIGKRIAAQRAIRKWTLRDLAHACDVSYGNLSKIERGLTDMSLSTTQKIADAFGVPLTELIGDAPLELASDQLAVLTAYAAGDLETLTRLTLTRIDAQKPGG